MTKTDQDAAMILFNAASHAQSVMPPNWTVRSTPMDRNWFIMTAPDGSKFVVFVQSEEIARQVLQTISDALGA